MPWGIRRNLEPQTASGIPLDDNAMTAAHKTLPFGSTVKVTNKKTGHAVTVTITDRGPYVKGRCIDLTTAGARALGLAGLAPQRGACSERQVRNPGEKKATQRP